MPRNNLCARWAEVPLPLVPHVEPRPIWIISCVRSKPSARRQGLAQSRRHPDCRQGIGYWSSNGRCNTVHSLQARTCKCLLRMHEIAGADLTQEFQAQMIGVRRPSVTGVPGDRQKAGMISMSEAVFTLPWPKKALGLRMRRRHPFALSKDRRLERRC
jgi:hypothetical protein